MVIMTKLLISGVIGVAIACLIFIGVVAPPWSELAKSFFSPRVSPNTPTIPIVDNATLSVNLTISNFTEPLGLDSEADVTVKVISRKDMSNVEVKITLSPIYIGQGAWPNITWTLIGPKGIDFIDGNSTWIINLIANVSTSFTTRIKATEIGLGVIVATAIWWDTPSTFHKSEAAPLHIKVLENNIEVYDASQMITFP
jgi:hypothetical protein